MATSKSCNRNQPIKNEGGKGCFTSMDKTSRTTRFQNSYNVKEHNIFSRLNELPGYLFNTFTQPESYFLKSSFDKETGNQLFELAKLRQEQGDTNAALILFGQSLQHDPENTGARFAYSKLLEQKGSKAEALEHYRLAQDIKKFSQTGYSKQLAYLHPLLHNHKVSWKFEPTPVGKISGSACQFLRKSLKLAQVACFTALLSFSVPVPLVIGSGIFAMLAL